MVIKVRPEFETPSPTILNLLSHLIRPTQGEVGLEIEVEGNQFPKPSTFGSTPVRMKQFPYWSCVKDGSLRGADNAEYILTTPIKFDEVNPALDQLWEALVDYGSVLSESNRTSVHVHLNAQGFHLNRLASFCALYFCFEEVLTEWCGDHRVGNLFCMRAKDAPAIVSKVVGFIRSEGKNQLPQSLHYSALNIHALTKLGSLEVRTLRGVTDFKVISDWVAILRRLYELSSEYKDPREIIGLFSQQGPLTFFETVLGPLSVVVRQGIGFDEDQIRDSMYEGIRIAQEVAYCRDWDLFQELNQAFDPFGRARSRGVSPPPSLYPSSPQTYAQIYEDFTPPVQPSPVLDLEIYEEEDYDEDDE